MAAGYRTDMADEARSLWNRSAGANTELPGVIAREENLGGLDVTAGRKNLHLLSARSRR